MQIKYLKKKIFCHEVLFLLVVTGLNLDYCFSNYPLSTRKTVRNFVFCCKPAKSM